MRVLYYFESGLESDVESDTESGLKSDVESGLESDAIFCSVLLIQNVLSFIIIWM